MIRKKIERIMTKLDIKINLSEYVKKKNQNQIYCNKENKDLDFIKMSK